MKLGFLKNNNLVLGLRHKWGYWKWQKGRTSRAAPHLYKRKVLNFYAKKFDLKIMVETGTYMGEMVSAMSKVFEEIYSIELAHEFFLDAIAQFAGSRHIKVLEGSSAEMLPKILPRLNRPVLFWLDGNYSGCSTAKAALQTPVVKGAGMHLCLMPAKICDFN